jgi:hypothetical protein
MARNRTRKNGNRDASGEVDRYRLALPEQEERRVSDPPASSRAWTTRSRRINTDPDNLERGLAQLVLTIVQLLRPAHGAPRHARSPTCSYDGPVELLTDNLATTGALSPHRCARRSPREAVGGLQPTLVPAFLLRRCALRPSRAHTLERGVPGAFPRRTG